MSPEVIEIAGLRFRLWPTPSGPEPLPEKGVIHPLTVLLDAVIHSNFLGLIDVLQNHRDIEYQTV